jgi:hypothetical protein
MSFKRTKVVMLSANEKAPLILGTSKNGKLVISNSSICNGAYIQNQHLHFLSDDEIKEGDWKYDTFHKEISQVKSLNSISKYDKKIIATTDRSLLITELVAEDKNNSFPCTFNLPQPSEGFIQKFVDSYNSGKPITDVDVELELSDYDIACDRWKLKVNPKDNTITIKKVKDSWTRDEVINLLQQFNNDKSGVFDCTGWIEENL